MSRVAERSDSGLGGALVESGLKADLSFTQCSRLFLAELAFVLVGHFRSQTRAAILRMLLSLRNRQHLFSLPVGKCPGKLETYDPAQGEEAQRHLRNIAPLVQVGRLENFFVWNTVLFDRRLESAQSNQENYFNPPKKPSVAQRFRPD